MKSLEITRDGEQLTVQARTGLAPLVFGATMEDMGGMETLLENSAQKKSEIFIEFQVTLPAEPLKHNGKLSNQSVMWSLDHTTLNNGDKLRQEAMRVMRASCASADMAFSPNTPPRLALHNFNLLTEQMITSGESLPQEKILNAALFIPYKMVIKRNFDIAGDGYDRGEHHAYLAGFMSIPKKLAPSKWGEQILLEITDDLGNSLKPSDEEDTYGYSGSEYAMSTKLQDVADNENERHPVFFYFNVPDWEAEMISMFKGEIALMYFSDMQIFKIAEAIGKEHIIDMEAVMNEKTKTIPDIEEKKLEHAGMSDAGVELTLQQAMLWGTHTALTFRIGESEASISQIQAFDAQGQPWPTLFFSESGDSVSEVMVPGKPEFPLSLAFLVSGGGSSVKIPIELENIALLSILSEKSLSVISEKGELKAELPLDSKELREQALQEEMIGHWLPVTEAEAEYLAEARSVATTQLIRFSEGQKLFGAEEDSDYMNEEEKVVVSARLYTPKGRHFLAIETIENITAIDNQDREVPLLYEDRPSAISYFSYDGFSDKASTQIDFVLYLKLPEPDAGAIEEVTGKTVVVTCSNWQEFCIDKVQKGPDKEIDLSEILPDATIIITDIKQRSDEQGKLKVQLKGTKEIRYLEFKLEKPGVPEISTYENIDNFSAKENQNVRDIGIGYYFHRSGSEKQTPTGGISLVVRYPEGLKRELVEFTLEAIDLY